MSRHIVLALFLAPALVLGGCIENMGDLKEALGVVEPVQPAAVYAPPLAKIDALPTAVVGALVRFVGEDSQDPQGLPLLYSWDFGDGDRASGAVATHAYGAAAEYIVKLTVTNAAGLSDDDILLVQVGAPDRAPSVGLRAPASGVTGEALAFEAFASDPEGAPIALEWDFGDGATSHDARPTHAYAKPGVYAVSVRATDAAGLRAEDSTRVTIDGAWSWEGTLAPTDAGSEKLSFPVAAGAKELDITLAFESGPLNDLELVVFDGAGKEVARSDAGLGGAPARTLSIEKPAPGEWSVRVVKDSGVALAWTVEVVERLS